MTRETKIGLLVGLAFIIVIGILLSDQLMRSTEPPPAPLSNVADTVRRATVTPASSQPPISQVQPSNNVAPVNPVRTREEIVQPPSPVTMVEIRPGGGPVAVGNGGNPNPIVNNGNYAGNNNTGNYGAGTVGGGPVAINGNNGGATGNNGGGAMVRPMPGDPAIRIRGGEGSVPGRNLADVAVAMGEPLVGPDGQPLRAVLPPPNPHGNNTDPASVNPFANNGNNPGNRGGNNNPLAAGAMKQYKVEPGDNLNRIATKVYGQNTKALRDLIVKANPSLAANPDKVVIGQTYNIPPMPTASGVPAGNTGGTTPPVARGTGGAPLTPPVTPPVTPPSRSIGGEIWYTVKAGDNLTKIAKEQCGDATFVAAIKELNKESLKGGDRLLVDMKLRLPAARPVASVN